VFRYCVYELPFLARLIQYQPEAKIQKTATPWVLPHQSVAPLRPSRTTHVEIKLLNLLSAGAAAIFD
jgi:hypothetical protein